MTERSTLVIRGHVATVSLNRPEKKNALDGPLFDSLSGHAQTIATDAKVRVVILRGEGSDFCAGIDVASFADPQQGATSLERLQSLPGKTANYFQNAVLQWRELPIPVVAVLRGCVFGAGLQIALGADLRFSAPDAKLSMMEIKWGLVPDMAITVTAPGVIAQDRFRELTYTGDVLDANEALIAGLITRVVDDPEEHAMNVATKIAAQSPDAVRAAKVLANSLVSSPASEEQQNCLTLEATLQRRLLSGDNHARAVAANLSKMVAMFTDPSESNT